MNDTHDPEPLDAPLIGEVVSTFLRTAPVGARLGLVDGRIVLEAEAGDPDAGKAAFFTIRALLASRLGWPVPFTRINPTFRTLASDAAILGVVERE